ncbi:sulfite exporter TauE/SafE family protein [Halovulum sp. GXIMD14793]
MSSILADYGLWALVGVFAVTAFGGFVKGAVGFALPMIMISGVGSLVSAELAIAGLILPALITNIAQAFREGPQAAWDTLRKYWRLNVILLIMIALCAQLVTLLSDRSLFLILGGMVTVSGILQLVGWRPHFEEARKNLAEWLTGWIAGFFGGLSGVWGPPITLYLLARQTPKAEMVRAQGISFLAGSVILIGAHIVSGVFNATSAQLSAWLVLPAMAGLIAGRVVQDRMDQERFRKLTLIVLVFAGLNLLRRGLM